jgi:hypothetical protein
MDPQKLALPARSPAPKREKAPRHKKGERFLCGPIPMSWLNAACKASGRGSGVKVALALWYESGLNLHARIVKLRSSVLRAMGANRHAGYRGLEALEKAGLVSIERRSGHNPVVTILDVVAAE